MPQTSSPVPLLSGGGDGGVEKSLASAVGCSGEDPNLSAPLIPGGRSPPLGLGSLSSRGSRSESYLQAPIPVPPGEMGSINLCC